MGKLVGLGALVLILLVLGVATVAVATGSSVLRSVTPLDWWQVYQFRACCATMMRYSHGATLGSYEILAGYARENGWNFHNNVKWPNEKS